MTSKGQYEAISVEQRGQVDWVTLNRPAQLNALDSCMIEELSAYFGGLQLNHDVRIVVLRGAGAAFCAGLDLRNGDRPDPAFDLGAQGPSEMLRLQRRISDIIIRMRRAPQPIVSLVQGAACGGGFALALAADIRIAGESMKMNAAFIRIGLSACDVGVSYFLPRIVGMSVASELMMTGRFIRAQRALAVGLVSEVVPDAQLEQAALSCLDDMLSTSPLGLRLTKDCLNHSINAPGLEAAIAMEDRNQVLCLHGEDFREGVTAFVEKRAPRYTGR